MVIMLLIRKLNTLGTKVMLLYWDFEYTDEDGKKRQTRTSQSLLEEVTYPVAMHQIIDDRTKKNDINIYNLFVSKESKQSSIDKNLVSPKISVDSVHVNGDGDIMVSEILSLKEGYGFIKSPPNNVFFHYSNLENADFNDLKEGMKVKYIRASIGDKVKAKNVWVCE